MNSNSNMQPLKVMAKEQGVVITTIKKLDLSIKGILGVSAEEYGQNTHNSYIQILKQYQYVCNVYQYRFLDNIKFYEDEPQKYITELLMYRDGVENILTVLEYFKNEIHKNPTSFIDMDGFHIIDYDPEDLYSMEELAEYIIETSINHEVIDEHIQSLKKYILDINAFINVDYPEHLF